MKASTVLCALFAGLVAAVPSNVEVAESGLEARDANIEVRETGIEARDSSVCDGFFGTPQCCGLNILGALSLDCQSPRRRPWTDLSFAHMCEQRGRSANCCSLPILGLGVLCQQVHDTFA